MSLRGGASSAYRPDIDGLRALAVIPVCLFHAGLPVFPGGFVGVDVFFVISGYLMASVIGRDLSDSAFSILDYYERRVRRIFPALVVVLAFTALMASAYLTPKFLRAFGDTLVASALFASNVVFWRKSENYFDATTELDPLLHLWSLSVEEQFYILFPVVLAVAWRFGRRVVFALVAGALAASLALSIWGVANAPTATFYLLPTRAWELLAGAIVALWPAGGTRPSLAVLVNNCAGLLGLVLILWAMIFFNPGTAFPGAAAIVPCLGAVLLIHSGRDGATLAARLLSVRPLTFVGGISYSLYLWHWPLLVFAAGQGWMERSPAFASTMIIVVSGFIAWASQRWVEQPFRRRDGVVSGNGLCAGAVASMALVAAFGVFARGSNGWPARFPGIAAVAIEPQLAGEQPEGDGWCFVDRREDWSDDRCFLSRRSPDKALLWGDSFASHYAYGFSATGSTDFDVLQYTSPQCPPVFGYDAASRPACAAFNSPVPSIIARHGITTVIMAANWHSYVSRRKMRLEDIQGTIDILRRAGARVVLVGQSPVFAFAFPDEYFFSVYGSPGGDGPYTGALAVNPDINRGMSAVAKPDVFFDALAPLCKGGKCVFKDEGLYLFGDHGHFTQAGSARMVAALLARIRAEASRSRSGTAPPKP